MCRFSRLPTVNSARPQRVAGREEPTWQTETIWTRHSHRGTRLGRSILAAPSPGRCAEGREHAWRPSSSGTGFRIGRRSRASSSGWCRSWVARRTWREQLLTRLLRSILAAPSPGHCAPGRSQAASGNSGGIGYRIRGSWTSSSSPDDLLANDGPGPSTPSALWREGVRKFANRSHNIFALVQTGNRKRDSQSFRESPLTDSNRRHPESHRQTRDLSPEPVPGKERLDVV